MKFLRRIPTLQAALLAQILFTGILFTGCETASNPGFLDVPPGVAAPSPASESAEAARFSIGDTVIVTFSGVDPAIPPHEELVKDDGTITLNLIGSVKAEGRTPGDLQKEIQNLYVPKYFLRLTVTIQPKDRVYYVGGEVKKSGPQMYLGKTTVTKAIQAAGDFTDFANKSSVELVRADGATITVNWKKAMANPHLDPPVFPGDKIHVKRRIF